MSEKNLSPAKVIPHVVRKIRMLQGALQRGDELYAENYICNYWNPIRRLIEDEWNYYKRQIEYWRDEYPEIVRYFENLPRYESWGWDKDPYRTGYWVNNHGLYATHYIGLVIRRRRNQPLVEANADLDDLPF